MKFDTAYLISILPTLFWAAGVNLALSVLVFSLSVLAGTLLTVVRTLKIAAVNLVIRGMISFVRGTPVLIQIFICYYALPVVGMNLSPIAAGVAALSLNSAAFVTEIMRGGLKAIDPGQIEASTALGLKRPAIWLRIVLPQMFRIILPALVNEGTVVVKATALLSVITVVDVLRTAQQLSASSFRPLEALLGAAGVFVVLNLLLVLAGSYLERSTQPRRG